MQTKQKTISATQHIQLGGIIERKLLIGFTTIRGNLIITTLI